MLIRDVMSRTKEICDPKGEMSRGNGMSLISRFVFCLVLGFGCRQTRASGGLLTSRRGK
jgi:hypothetical protein